jgi:hypothetical protein
VRNVREFCLNADFYVTFKDLLHAVKLRHGNDRFTSPPKEGVLRIFFALKIRRLRPAANPRTRVPKATEAAIKTAQLMLYNIIIALCSEIHAKHINAMWAENRISECQIWQYKR